MNYDDEVAKLLPWLRKMSRKFSRGDDADDLLGDTLLRLYRHRIDFRSVKELKTWCYVVMKHVFCSDYRRRQRIGFVRLEESDEPFAHEDLYEEVARREELRAVVELKEQYQSVNTLMLYAMGYGYKEIGMMLDVPLGTVRSRINNGRRIVRRMAI